MGWAVVPDESMIEWQGKSGPGGIPHLSHVPRKPHPLGLELKTLCDASTGMMMVIEIQEGKIRMARQRFCREYSPTTACTLGLCATADLVLVRTPSLVQIRTVLFLLTRGLRRWQPCMHCATS